MSLDLKNRVVRDGLVAVLYSPGFGAGWSTWSTEHSQRIVFDPFIVDLMTKADEDWKQKVEAYCIVKYPDMYLGGLDDLVIEWVPVGTEFKIDEYDGNESIVYRNQVNWLVA